MTVAYEGRLGGIADDVVALRAIGPDPVALRRRVLLEERGREIGGGVRVGIDEDPDEHRVRARPSA